MKTRAMKIKALESRALLPLAKAATLRTNKHVMRLSLLGALLLGTAALLAAPARADLVVAARLGDVAIRYSDGPDRSGPQGDGCRLAVVPVAPRVLVAKPVPGVKPAVRKCGTVVDQRSSRQRQAAVVWVPGHFEKRHAHGQPRKVWVAGHWRRI